MNTHISRTRTRFLFFSLYTFHRVHRVASIQHPASIQLQKYTVEQETGSFLFVRHPKSLVMTMSSRKAKTLIS